MLSNETNIYLPIRSLGDFIISASVVKDSFRIKIPLILPEYLKPLFDVTCSERYFDVCEYVSYRDQPAFFELYKVKSLNTLKRLINDIKTIVALGNNNNTYLLDYSSRRINFVRANLVWPDPNENIYTGKKKLFGKYYEKADEPLTGNLPGTLKPYNRILVLPGSRIQTKRIDTALVYKIIKTFKNFDIQIAEYGSAIDEPGNIIYYNNFDQLINLINKYDLIISAESLPYHLAQYFKKAHFVIYNRSKHFKRTFMTPFIIDNGYYSIYDGKNTFDVVYKLQNILNQ